MVIEALTNFGSDANLMRLRRVGLEGDRASHGRRSGVSPSASNRDPWRKQLILLIDLRPVSAATPRGRDTLGIKQHILPLWTLRHAARLTTLPFNLNCAANTATTYNEAPGTRRLHRRDTVIGADPCRVCASRNDERIVWENGLATI
jgi:hypothetical protein